MGNPSLVTLPLMNAGNTAVFSGVSLRPLESGRETDWDRFVLSRPDGSFFQTTGWMRAIQKTYGYEARYVFAERDGKIVGVAPLFFISNWVIGKVLNSVPFGVYGGICAEDAETRQALIDRSKEIAIQEKADFLELRARKSEPLVGFHPNSLYVTFTSELSMNHEANLKKLPRDTRYMIRKAEKAGLSVRHGMEQLPEFYALFAASMQRHGTPVFPLCWFENLHAQFGDKMDLLMIRNGEQPVAGVISFFFRETVLPYYAGAGPDAPRLAANNLLYWELMKFAADAGYRTFDFGRSKKGTGSYTFKTQWNMTLEPLDYQVFLVRRKTPPNFSPVNPKFERATRVWSRLPLWLTKQIGPRVVGWFP
ncbi:MAG: FemAB family XrtA/PEP-CTERM system-associated protein [Candidatus Acidiferrales bacterium]